MMLSLFNQTRLKGAVSRQTITFLLSLFTTKLESVLVNDKITAYKQQKRTYKKLLGKQVSRNQNSLRRRRSKGKGKGIRARDHAPFLSPSRAQIPPSPSPFNVCHAG